MTNRPNYWPRGKSSSSSKAAMDVGNAIQKTVRKVSNTLQGFVSLIQAITALAVADVVVSLEKAAKEVVEAKEAQETEVAESSEDIEESTEQEAETETEAESLEDIEDSLNEEQEAKFEDLKEDIKSGSLSIDEAKDFIKSEDEDIFNRIRFAEDGDDIFDLASDLQNEEPLFLPDPAPPLPIIQTVIEPDPEPVFLPPTLTFSSVLNDGVFTVTLEGNDPQGAALTFLINDVETQQISFTTEELSSGTLDDVTLTIISEIGFTITETVSPPTLVDNPGNDLPSPIEATFALDENQAGTFEVFAFDPEDGLLSQTIEILPQDADALFGIDQGSGVLTETVTFTDSDGETITQDYDITIEDLPDLAIREGVGSFTFAARSLIFGDPDIILASFEVNELFDFDVALNVTGVVIYTITNQDGIVLAQQLVTNNNSAQGGFDAFFSFDGDDIPPTTEIFLRGDEIDVFNLVDFFVAVEPEIFT